MFVLDDAKSFAVLCRDCGSAGFVGAPDPPYDCVLCHSRNIRCHAELFGLTIAPERLRQIRKERRSLGSYSSIKQISYEVRQAERIFKKNNIKFIDTTELSIEEISGKILEKTGIERRFRQ